MKENDLTMRIFTEQDFLSCRRRALSLLRGETDCRLASLRASGVHLAADARRCLRAYARRRSSAALAALPEVEWLLCFALLHAALCSVCVADTPLRLGLLLRAVRGSEGLPASGRKALLLAYLYGETWRDSFREEAEALCASLAPDADVLEARRLLAGLCAADRGLGIPA